MSAHTGNIPLPNSNYYLDQMMSIEMIKNLCSGKGKSEIAKFILIIGMDEFKRLFKVIIDKFIKEFQEFNWSNWLPSLLSWILRILTKPFRMLFSRRKEQPQDVPFCHDLDDLTLESHSCVLKTSSKLQHSFWEQVCSEAYKDKVTYRIKDIKSFDQTDNLTINSVEVWDNIKLSLPEQKIIVEFDDEVELRFSTRYNKKTLVSLKGQGGSTVSIGKFQNFTEKDFYLTNPVSQDEFMSSKNIGVKRKYPTKVSKITFERLIPSSKPLTDALEKAYQAIADFFDSDKTTSNPTVFKDLTLPDNKATNPSFIFADTYVTFDLDYYPFEKKPTFYYHRLILLLSIFIYDCVDNNRQCKNLKNEKGPDDYLNYRTGCSCTLLTESASDMGGGSYIYKVFGIPSWRTLSQQINLISHITLNLHKALGKKVREMPFFENDTNWMLLINHLCALSDMCPMYLDNNKTNPNNPKPTTENTSGCLPIRVLSNDYTSQEDLQKAFFNYLNTFSSSKTSQKATKIKTFDIKIEYKEKKVSTPNPAYALQQKRLEELRKAPPSEAIDKLVSEMIATMPVEMNEDIQISKEVVCTPINEVYKDLSRLYLAKKDKQKLTSMLRDFRDDKEMMEDLGLPNKLAVLLYGEPGCGKSSTIETVGSYLQKDIYNLNLQSVKTNEDLGKLWDYVTNQTANGGCIVIEDIDASTDVVLARTLQSTNNQCLIQITPNETPLSLSYFLNIIQGSCQRDNSVVVVTTNYLEKLDPAFTRSMRFDVKINMKKSSTDQIIEMYSVYFSRRTIPLELIKQIPEHKYTPAMFIDCFRQYIKNPDFTDEELFADFLGFELI